MLRPEELWVPWQPWSMTHGSPTSSSSAVAGSMSTPVVAPSLPRDSTSHTLKLSTLLEPCSMARELLQEAGVAMVLCEEFEDSVVVQGRRTSGLHSIIATARAGVVDGGEK